VGRPLASRPIAPAVFLLKEGDPRRLLTGEARSRIEVYNAR
jgi:hypothetical protein